MIQIKFHKYILNHVNSKLTIGKIQSQYVVKHIIDNALFCLYYIDGHT